MIDFVIVGTPRSGTTLVQRLCDEIPGVAAVGETHFYTVAVRRFDTLGLTFPLDPDELRVALRSWAALPLVEGLDVDIDQVARSLDDRCDTPAELFSAIVRQLAPSGVERVGEKTPDQLRRWKRMTREMPDLKVIWVVRDPRDVAPSLVGVPWGDQSIIGAARRWRRDVVRLGRARAQLDPRRLLIVRFEDALTDPGAARGTIARFLDVADPGTHQPAATDGTPDGLSRDWEWWKHGASAAPDETRAQAWREDPRHVAMVEQICREGLDELGYGRSLDPARRTWRLAVDGDLWQGALEAVRRTVRRER